jgi:hypothetical protein
MWNKTMNSCKKIKKKEKKAKKKKRVKCVGPGNLAQW